MTTETVSTESSKQTTKKEVITFKPRYFVLKAMAHRRLGLLNVARSHGEANKYAADENFEELQLNGVEIMRLNSFKGDICLEDVLDKFQKDGKAAR